MATGTYTSYPSAFDSGSYSSISNQTNPVGKGSTNTTYATITCRTGSRAETYAFWEFDWSVIPADAIITSVTGTAKCYVSSTTYVTTRAVQLYSGSTAKGSAVSFTNSTSAATLSCGTWTRSELDNMRIRVYGMRGTSSTSRSASMRFYGATITVAYTYETRPPVHMKINGTWTQAAKVYKKVNGAWVEQSDFSQVFESGKVYIKK